MNFDQKVGKKFQHAQQDVEHPHPIALPLRLSPLPFCEARDKGSLSREEAKQAGVIMDFHHSSTLTCVLKKSCSHKISQGHDEDGAFEDINNQQFIDLSSS